ncbi:MAG: lysine transporter LysE [Rhizobiales bacterium NRL2]|jgi:threonine/homoserine/homoserine lactone efflux protein|nr:MAG: lysine transporter LysE [Rhizobiales bacterium NRL2]
MPLELWIAFVLASAALLAVPGPTVMLAVSHALNGGRRTALGTVPGTMLGDFTAMTVSLAGAGAVLAASATLFTALKLVGAAYLIWLGVKLWRAKPDPAALEQRIAPASMQSVFLQSFVVTALNPKGIVFFVAFVPQFVDPAAPVLMQFVVLEATFVILAGVNVALWAMAAGTLRARFRQPATMRLVNRIGGGFLIGAGLLTAAVRRA